MDGKAKGQEMSEQQNLTMPLSRRSVLGSLGASALLAGVPAPVLARTLAKSAPAFPGLTKIINDYVAEKEGRRDDGGHRLWSG